LIEIKQEFYENQQVNPPPGEPIIQLRGVVKTYQTVAGEFMALKGINLDIHPGEFVGILGKSGAGKTTLVNLLTGIDHLTKGEIWVAGTPVHKLMENHVASWRGRMLGVVYQSFQLMPTLSILNNVLLPMDFSGQYRNGRSTNRAMGLLRQVELEDHARKLPALISGGQQQRVAIARALANDPPIIIADEPTGRLDSATADTVMQVFETLVMQGKTILMVSHDASLIHRFSRVVWLADGLITPEQQFTAV
jgi:putative ABC transport system ATP-binding protein